MKKKNIYDLNIYREDFKKDINNKDDYEYYEFIYNNIKKDYEKLIEKKEINIKVEIVRIEGKLSHKGSNSFSAGISLTILSFSILINGLIQYFTISKNISDTLRPILIFVFSIIFSYIVLFPLTKTLDSSNKKDLLNVIRWRVLNDIEKEQSEANKTINSNIIQEVAVTKDMQVNTQNKRQKKSGKKGKH